jgi:hypothetical protein
MLKAILAALLLSGCSAAGTIPYSAATTAHTANVTELGTPLQVPSVIAYNHDRTTKVVAFTSHCQGHVVENNNVKRRHTFKPFTCADYSTLNVIASNMPGIMVVQCNLYFKADGTVYVHTFLGNDTACHAWKRADGKIVFFYNLDKTLRRIHRKYTGD